MTPSLHCLLFLPPTQTPCPTRRFGFPNRDALDAGETGTACRGEEHDVTIVWSIFTGKRLILADGQEVHYSMARGTKLEFSWTLRGNRVLKVVAHAAPQVNATPGWRQYDLFIDGQSFFGMPKVYELGIKGPVASEARAPGVRSGNGGGGGGDARGASSSSAYRPSVEGEPRSREEEDIELAKAISASLEESRQHLKRTVETHRAQDPNLPAITAGAAPGGDLLDFAGPAPSAPAAPALPPSTNYAPAPPAQPAYHASFAAQPPAQPPGAMVPVAPQPGAPYGGYGGGGVPLQPAAPQYAAAPVFQQAPAVPAIDQFATQSVPVVGDDPFAPKALTFNDMTSSIMGQYGGPVPPPETAPVQQQQYQQPPMAQAFAQQPPVEQYNGTNGHTEPAAAAPEAQFANLAVSTSEPDDEDGISSAMKKLINIDDIGSPVVSMNPFGDDKDTKKNKTKAIPPVSQKFGNPSASLSQIQTIKTSASGEKKMVMNSMPQTHDGSGGALVVSGTQIGGYSVPPSNNRPTGFGVGAVVNGGGYGGGMGGPAPPMTQPQQQPPMMQQPGYGAHPPMQQQQQQMPMQQPPMMQQQPMYGQQPPPPPQQGGYSNYTY